MLELKDFNHLPQVDQLMDQLVADRPGLVLLAGLDARPAYQVPAGMLAGGVSVVFGVLARQLIAAHGMKRTVVIAENKDAVRLPASFRSKVQWALIKAPMTYAEQIAQVAHQQPGLIILDQMEPEFAADVLQWARSGIRILSRIDCLFSGNGVARHLAELGVPREHLDGLRWIITIQRLPTLCPNCKSPAVPDSRMAELARQYPHLPSEPSYAQAKGCGQCHQTGRRGDVLAFDLFRAPDTGDVEHPDLFEQPSLLSLEEYALHLAALGHVSIDDVVQLRTEQLHRTFLLLNASERALTSVNTKLRRKVAELETAQRVLERQNQSLISIQELAHSLIASTELDDLAQQICRATSRLGGADRSILYVRQSDGTFEVAAVSGWDNHLVHARLDAAEVLNAAEHGDPGDGEPTPFRGFPPGVPRQHEDIEGVALRAGLRVPLVAQQQIVGVMVVHSTRKTRFEAGDMAMLQTLANQAALAIQRAALVRSLRENIHQLTAAQAELVKKERLERELELARAVQQSFLPHIFPELPDCTFAARSEAARRVGGDFYDVFRVDEDHVGLVIADVSDKGMPAALFMALTRSLLFAEARRELSPRKVLTSVHRLLLELGQPEMFVTAFYGVLDRRTRILTYSRAGHEEPLLQRRQDLLPLRGKGTFLGSLDVSQFHVSEEQVQMEPHDRLVLYTDGIVDAMDSREQPFGLDRFLNLLREQVHAPLEELCRHVFDRLADFQGKAEQFDDMTLVVMDLK